tara:strand:- start:21 stop:464 length:444 start_codon:yes stop_codon:yes gene_type:complete
MTDTNKKSEQSFEEVLKTLSSLKTQVTGLVNQTKSLEKSVKKQVKSLEKEAKKNRMKGNRKASGFAVPKPVSPELCSFMQKPQGSEFARTEVTKYIIKYIQENNLQNPKDKREIIPDKALKIILKPKKNTPVTYFNIQRLMNPHFSQ